jgi:hypothetical protein
MIRSFRIEMESFGEIISRPLTPGDQYHLTERLKGMLREAELLENDYDKREIIVAFAVALAKLLGYKAGVRFDSSSDEARKWPVFCIDLPEVGEVSWHSPAYEKAYDGYSTEEKYRRCHEFIANH